DEPAPRLQALENRARVTAAAERAVHRDFTRRGPQPLENLGDHDGSMRARRRLSRCQDLLHVRPVLLRLQFLVLVRKGPRIVSCVALTSRWAGRWQGHPTNQASTSESRQ